VVTLDVDRLQLSVEDHGPGIPESERERIFERFHRMERHRGEPGLGLGLSIVRGLVKGAGGEIWIDEAEGGGTAVRVSLPTAEQGRQAV
jgi:signal transduction histidine kinase